MEEVRDSSTVEELIWDHLVDSFVISHDEMYSEDIDVDSLSYDFFSKKMSPYNESPEDPWRAFSEYADLRLELAISKARELHQSQKKIAEEERQKALDDAF